MRIVFMGTPQFAATVLENLVDQHDVVCVYTRKDAVRSRGNKPVASPVKQIAVERGIEVRQPDTLRDPAEVAYLTQLAPDAICVAAFGMILPKEVLDIPRYGCLNVHASLLPKYRGAAPIERAILNGDDMAGVCIMRMEEGLDTGDFCISRAQQIDEMPLGELSEELAIHGATGLLVALGQIEQGGVRWTKQDDSEATYAPKLEKGELNLDPEVSATVNARRVQASSEPHPARCVINGKGVTVTAATARFDKDAPNIAADLEPGHVAFMAKRLFLGCADGPLELVMVKPDGRKEMPASSFASGVQNIKSNRILWEKMS